MAMATRLRLKKGQELQNTESMKIKMFDSKMTTKTNPDDKRKAFGDINNRQNIGAVDSGKLGLEKDKKNGAIVYKDVKPRVDTRWKKTETTAPRPVLGAKSSVTGKTSLVPAAKPLSRQNSRAGDVKKEKTVKSITEQITMQIKKTTSITSCIEIKKEKVVECASTEWPLIRSPVSMKLKKERELTEGQKFFESHSTYLLQQVENIDENDKGNPQLLSEYVADIYAYLMKVETAFPIRSNFLDTQMDVTPKMRSVLLDWINEVHHQFNLENETFHMAVSMLDRYLQKVSSTPRKFLQLVGVTALFMASKFEELMPPEITDFVYVTDDTYSKEQILQMEMKIFKALDFHLGKPLPIHFLRRYAKAAGSLADRQYLASKYFLELAAMDYELTMYKPSEIAAASLYLALYITNKMKSDEDVWTPTLQYYSTYSVDSLKPIVKRLASVASTAHEVKLKSVYNKYSSPHFKFTSTLPEMTGAKINELIRSE